jgi:hypothetical protein
MTVGFLINFRTSARFWWEAYNAVKTALRSSDVDEVLFE